MSNKAIRAAMMIANRKRYADGGFLDKLFSGPDYLSTGKEASFANMPTQDETNADFFKADKAARAAAAQDIPLPPRRPLPVSEEEAKAAPPLSFAPVERRTEQPPAIPPQVQANARDDNEKFSNRVAPEEDTPVSQPGSLKGVIDQASTRANIDPRIMYGIVAGESLHGHQYDINISPKEASYGPFQLNIKGGLGNVFERETGLSVKDPRTIYAQAHWVADYLAKNPNLNIGKVWYGYRGNSNWDPKWGNAGYVGEETTTPPAPTRVAEVPQDGQKYGLFAFGTNDLNRERPEAGVARAVQSAQQIYENAKRAGISPVFVLPNSVDPRFAPISDALRKFAEERGIRYEAPAYSPRDPLHLTVNTAKELAKKYPNALVGGDSNSYLIHRYGYNRPVFDDRTVIDPVTGVKTGLGGAGSPAIAKFIRDYADQVNRGHASGGMVDNDKAIRSALMTANGYARGGYADGGPTDDDAAPGESLLMQEMYGNPITGETVPMNQGTQLSEPLRKAVENYAGNVGKAFHESGEYAKQGLENTVSDKGPLYNVSGPLQYMLGSAGQVFSPLTGAAMSAGQGATQLTGNPEFGNRVEFLAGFADPTHVGAIKNATRIAHEMTPFAAVASMAPRAVEAASTPARELSPLGLYSHGAETAAALPQAKGSPDQMIAMLKRAGVKDAELEGVADRFGGQKSVTRDELAQHFRENMPVVEEKVLGKNPSSEELREYFDMSPQAWDDLSSREFLQLRSEYARNEGLNDPVKFEQYTLPGGENYREVLLKAPSDARLPSFEEWFNKTHVSPLETYADNPRMMERFRAQYAEEAKNLPQEVSFRSSHWDDPNVLAHLRMSDRTGPNGEKILHVEEVQSDWGQKGKKEGFTGEPRIWKEANPDGTYNVIGFNRDRTQRVVLADNATAEQADQLIASSPGHIQSGIPKGPYVTSTEGWTDLALKRALKEAAEGGYDKLVWTPGAEQAKRYDLSKQISRLILEDSPRGEQMLRAYSPSGDQVIAKRIVNAEEELPNIVGKEVTEKLLAQDPLHPKRFNENLTPDDISVVPKEHRYQISAPWGWSTHVGMGVVKSPQEAAEYAAKYFSQLAKEANSKIEYQGPIRSLEGQQLSIGGEGMKGYYDKILPKRMQELVKKHDKDVKVEMSRLPVKGSNRLAPDIARELGMSIEEIQALPHEQRSALINSVKNSIAAPGITITPKMRESILRGQTAFARGGFTSFGPDAAQSAVKLAKQQAGRR